MKLLLATAATIAIGSASYAADAPAFQGKLYATAWFGGVVSVVDVATRKMTANVPVGIQNHNIILGRYDAPFPHGGGRPDIRD